MIRVELVWQKTATQLNEVRSLLRDALRLAGLSPHWQEWRGDDNLLPRHLKYRSPLALFVNGSLVIDFQDHATVDAAYLSRLISKQGERTAAPGIREPLGRRISLSVLPALLLVVLPKCPLCWAAYVGAAGAFGITTAAYHPWLLLTMGVLTGLSVASMFFQARSRNGYGPALLAVGGLTLVLAGKFVLDLDALMYAGLFILITSAMWNAFPLRTKALPL